MTDLLRKEMSQMLFDSTMSDDGFFHFATQMENWRIERDKNGNVLIMAPVGMESGRFEVKPISALDRWNDDKGNGYVFSSSTGFTLPNSAVRSPDAAWISKERYEALSEQERQRFGHICPDFVLEIRSNSDSLAVLKEKMEEYIECGARLGFLIDPANEKAYVYKPEAAMEEITDFTQELSGEEVMQGFLLPLKLFKRL